MDVYLDVLFIENLVINYLILLLTSKMTRQKASSLRLLSGSLVGALYVCFLVVFPGIKVYVSIPAKILLSVSMIAITFNISGIKAFVKALLVFYVITLVFAGTAFAVMLLSMQGRSIIESGVFYIYYNSKLTMMLLAILASLIMFRTIWEIFRQRITKDSMLINLKIHFGESIVSTNALVDTGNHLVDPLTRLPVVIVEFSVLSGILPESIRSVFAETKEDDLGMVTTVISGSPWINRFRLIPFASIGKENGMMIGFKPDYIEIGEGKVKVIYDAIIAVYNRILSKSDGYRALIGPELM